jgi:glutamyl-tRNA reductase
MVVGEPPIIAQVKEAWKQAQKVGASGRCLDAVMQKALSVSGRLPAPNCSERTPSKNIEQG